MVIQAALTPQFRFFSKPLLHCRRGLLLHKRKKLCMIGLEMIEKEGKLAVIPTRSK